jgi:hypothetical protein
MLSRRDRTLPIKEQTRLLAAAGLFPNGRGRYPIVQPWYREPHDRPRLSVLVVAKEVSSGRLRTSRQLEELCETASSEYSGTISHPESLAQYSFFSLRGLAPRSITLTLTFSSCNCCFR